MSTTTTTTDAGTLNGDGGGGFCYTLGGGGSSSSNSSQSSSLYIPITSQTNTCSLPETRGRHFLLPSYVVACLCRVREAEYNSSDNNNNTNTTTDNNNGRGGYYSRDKHKQRKNIHHCTSWFVEQDSYQKLPPPPTRTRIQQQIETEINNNGGDEIAVKSKRERRPTVNELLMEVKSILGTKQGKRIQNIVIGGEGEPLLRYNSLLELIRELKQLLQQPKYLYSDDDQRRQQQERKIRLTTNGVYPVVALAGDIQQNKSNKSVVKSADDIIDDLITCGLDSVSVSLMTNDEQVYNVLMQPKELLFATAPSTRTPGTQTTREVGTTPIMTPHERIQDFVHAAIKCGTLDVELTAVDHHLVDRNKTEQMAKKFLGVQKPVRWRTYHD